MKFPNQILLACLSAMLMFPAMGNAASIFAVATDLVDVTPGENLWKYSYSLSGGSFATNQGFTIFFDPTVYGPLSDPYTANAGWDLAAVDPDTGIPAAGFFDALAVTNGASLDNTFEVKFIWRAVFGSTPAAQPFETYICEDVACNNVSITDSGTTSPVPVPPSLVLLASGLVTVGALQRRIQRPKDAFKKTPEGKPS